LGLLDEDALYRIGVIGRVEAVRGAQLLGELELGGVDIDGEDPPRPRELRRLNDSDADGA
jgi:hypothetical protein